VIRYQEAVGCLSCVPACCSDWRERPVISDQRPGSGYQ
jgi:hypothetical protein